jgi:hypothetical protein
MGDQRAASPPAAADLARALAARVAALGYQVRFRRGRDPAAFMVDGLPGDPDVEVSVEDDGWTSCYYTARSPAHAAAVIARLPLRGHPHAQAFTCGTLAATWDGTDIEWHHLPPRGRQPAGQDDATGALLAHLAVLDGRDHHDREDAPR